jgi:hypothetical protein
MSGVDTGQSKCDSNTKISYGLEQRWWRVAKMLGIYLKTLSSLFEGVQTKVVLDRKN